MNETKFALGDESRVSVGEWGALITANEYGSRSPAGWYLPFPHDVAEWREALDIPPASAGVDYIFFEEWEGATYHSPSTWAATVVMADGRVYKNITARVNGMPPSSILTPDRANSMRRVIVRGECPVPTLVLGQSWAVCDVLKGRQLMTSLEDAIKLSERINKWRGFKIAWPSRV